MVLGELIDCWMRIKGVTLRELAKDIDINMATLHRVCQGEDVSGSTLIKILQWAFRKGSE